jgi:endonuclease I
MKRVAIVILATIACLFDSGAQSEQTKHSTYDKARSVYWAEIYPPLASGSAEYSELYCAQKFRKNNPNLTLEHAYPAGWIAGARKCGTRKECQDNDEKFGFIEADFQNLFPAGRRANIARSNNLYGELPDSAFRPIANCPLKVDTDANIAEPRAIVRGNVARAIFYMAVTYDLPIDRTMLPVLLEWHRADPVTKDERRLHDLKGAAQETTNDFITGKRNPAKVKFKLCDAVFTGNTVSWKNCED